MHRSALIVLDDATIVRPIEGVVARGLNWTIHAGETWAIVGPVGSGKTTLADAVAGRLHVEGVHWPFIERLRASGRVIDWPSQVIERVSFKEESRLFSYSRHYYQQRFNFIEPGDDLTLDQFLRRRAAINDAECQAVCARLRIEEMRDLSLIKLSNGQTRRARIARALLSHPELLILDEPFMGLDAAGRSEVADILGELIERGLAVLLITRPDAIPSWVTHVLELERLAIRWQGTASAFAERTCLKPPHPGPLPRSGGEGERTALPLPRFGGEGRGEGVNGINLNPANDNSQPSTPLVELRNVSVAYDGRPILHDVSWTVREGERWALVGPNGSGKTTLLSLIAADHPQAYSNDIYLFGQKRGSGESIWDIKRNIGLVSPEMHLYFSEPLSAFRAAATGFFDVLAHRPTTPAQDETLWNLFHFFGLTDLAERAFSRLSTGEQRLVLLIRALVKAPPLLILDEPFQGLDNALVTRLRAWLDEKLRPEQTLIFVTHLPEEVPQTVNRCLRLERGEIVELV